MRHPGDRSCEAVVDHYRSLLKPDDDTFLDLPLDLPLDRLVERWRGAAPDEGAARWLDEVARRYPDLHLSAG